MSNYLRGTSCYLVGPIENDPTCGSDWRKYAASALAKFGVKIYNPLDRPTWMSPIAQFIPPAMSRNEIVRALDTGFRPIMNAQSITRRICKRFVATCDFVFCYLTDTKTYGTTEELADAYAMGKPIIAVTPMGCPSLWLYDILRDEMQFDTVCGAIDYLRMIDNGTTELDAIKWIFIGDDYELKHIVPDRDEN
jgi:hypothetical protein